MLALSEVTRYLLGRGLVEAVEVVDGHLEIVDASSRNQNCAVRTDEGHGLFLKQDLPPPAITTPVAAGSGPAPLAHEAAVYALIRSLGRGGQPRGVAALLPDCVAYDPDHGLLVLELLDGAEDLSSYHARTGRFPVTLASRLGTALADLHERALAPALRRPAHFSGRLPWALALDRPGSSLWREASNAGLELIGILQSVPEMRAVLARLRAEWRVDAFLHHDIKWDNCLVLTAGASQRSTRLALVDWEFADLGDACWDVGAVFGNYLSFWLGSIPVTGNEPPDHYLDLARHPLERMQPAMGRFWAAYVRGRGWDSATAAPAAVRCARYAGVRLLQSTYERTQHKTHLDGNDVCLLQLALNVMTRPLEAIHHLLGIPADGVRA